MKKSQALAYVRQLCCLGLNPQALAAELLHAIKTVIPSENNSLTFWDEQPYPKMLVPEFMEADALDILINHGREVFTAGMVANIADWHRHNRLIDNACVADETFYRTNLYNLVWLPCRQHHLLHGLVTPTLASGVTLSVCRPRSSPPFSLAEKQDYLHLLPYVRHALGTPSVLAADYGTESHVGMLVMDAEGQVVFANETAKHILWVAQYPAFKLGQGKLLEITVPTVVSQLCRQLNGIFAGKQAAPPVLAHENARGRFVFRAYWLDPVNREAGKLIGLTIEHQEPLALQVLRALKDWPLSPAQMEICLLLAQNLSHEAIAQRLKVKPTTVKDHVRKIYDKLGIHQREELLAQINAANAN